MTRTARGRLTIIAMATLIAGTRVAGGQAPIVQSPFLFVTVTPAVQTRASAAFDAGYNARAFEPVAGERLESRASGLVALSPWLVLHGQFATASTLDHHTRLAEQLETMVTPLRYGAYSLGGSLGMRHEYTGANVALARVAGARVTPRSALAADVLVEHAYARGRDAADIVTTLGATRALTSGLWLGVEAVGSDLEGLLDSEETEGGATVLVGPTLAVAVSDRWRLVVGGGPVLRATTSRIPLDMHQASVFAGRNTGYVLRTSLRLGW